MCSLKEENSARELFFSASVCPGSTPGFQRSTHHPSGEVAVDKLLPADLMSSIPEEEITGDGCPEGQAGQQKHPELSIVPRKLALKHHNLITAPGRISSFTAPPLTFWRRLDQWVSPRRPPPPRPPPDDFWVFAGLVSES